MASDLFHSGGSCQRKLNVDAPEVEGYTGSYLIKTVGANGCLYIMPIQNSVDISPLPYSSKEFEKKMPRARCAKCHTDKPVIFTENYSDSKSVI